MKGPFISKGQVNQHLDKQHEQNWQRLVRLLRDEKCTGRYDLMADAAKMIERMAGHVEQLAALAEGHRIRIDQLSASSAEQPINQCDGCRRGLKTRTSVHGSVMHDGEDGMPVMICTADRYTSNAEIQNTVPQVPGKETTGGETVEVGKSYSNGAEGGENPSPAMAASEFPATNAKSSLACPAALSNVEPRMGELRMEAGPSEIDLIVAASASVASEQILDAELLDKIRDKRYSVEWVGNVIRARVIAADGSSTRSSTATQDEQYVLDRLNRAELDDLSDAIVGLSMTLGNPAMIAHEGKTVEAEVVRYAMQRLKESVPSASEPTNLKAALKKIMDRRCTNPDQMDSACNCCAHHWFAIQGAVGAEYWKSGTPERGADK